MVRLRSVGAFVGCVLALGACDRPSATTTIDAASSAPSAAAMPTPAPSVVAAPSAASVLRPSASAHFEVVPGTEGRKMPTLRGDADYAKSYTYQLCMRTLPHRPDEAVVCKQLNDACVDNRRSQEACDADTKESPGGWSNLKKLYGK